MCCEIDDGARLAAREPRSPHCRWRCWRRAARAETIGGALAKAYLNNPDINQQRAAVRVQDENIPKANAGYLPTVSAEADAGLPNTLAPGLGPGYAEPVST